MPKTNVLDLISERMKRRSSWRVELEDRIYKKFGGNYDYWIGIKKKCQRCGGPEALVTDEVLNPVTGEKEEKAIGFVKMCKCPEDD